MKMKQEQLTVGEMDQQQLTLMCLSTCGESSDSQFNQAGDHRYKPEIAHGCYHNCQKPAAE